MRVPQGSVFGPLLWDIAYDGVVRVVRSAGCTTMCYADDMLIVAIGRSWRETRRRAERCTDSVIADVRETGLAVNAKKTEATRTSDSHERTTQSAEKDAKTSALRGDTLPSRREGK